MAIGKSLTVLTQLRRLRSSRSNIHDLTSAVSSLAVGVLLGNMYSVHLHGVCLR